MGTVLAIWTAPEGKAPMVSRDEVKAIEGRGLDGDRYADGLGSYSDKPGTGREVTLIEQEALDAIRNEDGIDVAPGASRRNVVTSGVALNHFVDREFRVGEVILRGTRLCEPCNDLAQLIGEPIVKPLLHRAGLRAEIVRGGTIRVGDEVAPA